MGGRAPGAVAALTCGDEEGQEVEGKPGHGGRVLSAALGCPAGTGPASPCLILSACSSGGRSRDAGWANFLTRGPQWVLKLDRRAGTKAWMECLCELI